MGTVVRWNNLRTISKSFSPAWVHAKSLQLWLTLWDPMDWSLPGSSLHRIFSARILEWVAISFSRGPSWPRDQTHVSYVSCIDRQVLLLLVPPGKPPSSNIFFKIPVFEYCSFLPFLPPSCLPSFLPPPSLLFFTLLKIQNVKFITYHYCDVMCLVAQLCLTLFDPMDCSPPGSSV